MPAPNSAVETYLAKAARRRQWAEFGGQLVRFLWVFGALFLILILVARLSATLSDRYAWPILGGLPVVAAVLAWISHRRISETEAATLVDRYENNHDLFLTTVHLDESSGAYQAHIRAQAEERASREAPLSKMIPWAWQKPCLRLLGGLLVLVVALLFLPQLDPFGKEETREWLSKQEERLEELQKENEAVQALLKSEETEKRAEEIAQALAKLEKTFQLARPEQQEATRKALRDRQKELGNFWKQLDDEKLTKALNKESDRWQKIGQTEATMSPEAKAMRDELREMLRNGDAKKLQDRLAEMLEKVEKQQQGEGSAEEQAQERAAMKESLQELASAISAVSPSDPLKASLQRAIEQMQTAQNPGLQDQAMEGAKQSMEQLQQQMKSLAEQLQQLQELESAMDAAQLAQQLNELGEMNGQKSGGKGKGEGMKGYADLYKELLAASQGGEGPGPGMRGPGTGKGGVAPEDESLATGFKKEQSPSHLVAGKTLLQWQTKEASEAGKATKAYQESLQQLRQGLSEAIRQEKVPAGYHDQIQNYFDTMKEEPVPDADGLD